MIYFFLKFMFFIEVCNTMTNSNLEKRLQELLAQHERASLTNNTVAANQARQEIRNLVRENGLRPPS